MRKLAAIRFGSCSATVVQGQRKSPDGNRFLLVLFEPEAEASARKIRFVEKWFDEFRDREQN